MIKINEKSGIMIKIAVTLMFIVTSLSVAQDTISFQDPNLANIIKTQLEIGLPITKNQSQSVNYLCIDSCEMSSLSGIENFTNLVSLQIYNCNIGDYSAIRHLSKLKELRVRNCNFKDLDHIKNLTSLEYLILTDNQLCDVSPISSFNNCNILAKCHDKFC